MTIREKIFMDLFLIKNPRRLQAIFDFVQKIKNSFNEQEENVEQMLQFAGTLDHESAVEISGMIDKEFSKIEGDW